MNLRFVFVFFPHKTKFEPGLNPCPLTVLSDIKFVTLPLSSLSRNYWIFLVFAVVNSSGQLCMKSQITVHSCFALTAWHFLVWTTMCKWQEKKKRFNWKRNFYCFTSGFASVTFQLYHYSCIFLSCDDLHPSSASFFHTRSNPRFVHKSSVWLKMFTGFFYIWLYQNVMRFFFCKWHLCKTTVVDLRSMACKRGKQTLAKGSRLGCTTMVPCCFSFDTFLFLCRLVQCCAKTRQWESPWWLPKMWPQRRWNTYIYKNINTYIFFQTFELPLYWDSAVDAMRTNLGHIEMVVLPYFVIS